MGNLAGLKILVIEDMQELLIFHQRWLKLEKADFIGAMTGGEGIRAFEENPDIEVILLDMLLPDIHGMDVFHKVREMRPEIPIVVCSGYNDNTDELLKYDRVKFIGKPFLLPDLKAAILEMAGRA